MNIVVAPDSYKGSLTAVQVGETMAKALQSELPDAIIHIIPMADGGEGTVDAVLRATGGRRIEAKVTGPLGEAVETYFGTFTDERGPGAVIEAANICGLTMVPKDRRNPRFTTTRGLGEMIRIALDQGIRRMLIGLGGSATNDGGLGMLCALGAQALAPDERSLQGFGADLFGITSLSLQQLDPRLAECELVIASDVRNALLGPEGASYVFAPQKGAAAHELAEWDEAMCRYAELLEFEAANVMKLNSRAGDLPMRLRELAGAGAAGGLGFALLAIGGRIISGAQAVEQICGLHALIGRCDWVLTGEGRSDGQTLQGKLPFYVAELARAAGKRAVLISGSLGGGSEQLTPYFAGCFAALREPADVEECMRNAEQNVLECTRSVARLIRHFTT
ncbi:glycerate kinase [Paenibacillus turpanensis]|uniref:glycerate kinase n=1 Tax=Paenibacillus turpanensis TaxID=2689078 RepID=UPI00140A58C7